MRIRSPALALSSKVLRTCSDKTPKLARLLLAAAPSTTLIITTERPPTSTALTPRTLVLVAALRSLSPLLRARSGASTATSVTRRVANAAGPSAGPNAAACPAAATCPATTARLAAAAGSDASSSASCPRRACGSGTTAATRLPRCPVHLVTTFTVLHHVHIFRWRAWFLYYRARVCNTRRVYTYMYSCNASANVESLSHSHGLQLH